MRIRGAGKQRHLKVSGALDHRHDGARFLLLCEAEVGLDRIVLRVEVGGEVGESSHGRIQRRQQGVESREQRAYERKYVSMSKCTSPMPYVVPE